MSIIRTGLTVANVCGVVHLFNRQFAVCAPVLHRIDRESIMKNKKNMNLV